MCENGKNIKEINVTLNVESFSIYRKKLNVIQSDVNEYLTSLIDQDSTG